MPLAWQPQDRDTLNHWIQTIIEEAEEKLTDWERNFVNDMQIRLANKWKWTESQEKKLEQIYADKTS